jgi:hypothetical protein
MDGNDMVVTVAPFTVDVVIKLLSWLEGIGLSNHSHRPSHHPLPTRHDTLADTWALSTYQAT